MQKKEKLEYRQVLLAENMGWHRNAEYCKFALGHHDRGETSGEGLCSSPAVRL